MKVDLTKEEIRIINEMCFGELIEMGKIKNNRFIDKAQVENYIEKIQIIINKTCINGSEV